MVSELIQRLEAATGGSYKLSREVAEMEGWRDTGTGWMGPDSDRSDPAYAYFPQFTTSLDAALTLVPEGWRIANMKDGLSRTRADKRLCCQISLWCPANPSLGHGFQSVGATPPLALCIAALKARAA